MNRLPIAHKDTQNLIKEVRRKTIDKLQRKWLRENGYQWYDVLFDDWGYEYVNYIEEDGRVKKMYLPIDLN